MLSHLVIRIAVFLSSGWPHSEGSSQTSYTKLDLELHQERPRGVHEQVSVISPLHPTASYHCNTLRPLSGGRSTMGDVGKKPKMVRKVSDSSLPIRSNMNTQTL